MNMFKMRLDGWFWFSLLIAPFVAWALRAQALWSQGHLGYFGLAKEASSGTAVAATDYIELLSENLQSTIDRFTTKNIFASFNEPDDYAGARRSAGGIVLAAHPVSVGHALKAIFGNMSGSTITSGFLYTSHFTSTKSEFSDGVPRQPYTLEVFRDVTSAHRYIGAVANRLQLALAPNQAMQATLEWIAKSRALIARTTPTFPGSSIDPFAFDTCSVQLAGSATAKIEGFTLTVDNQLEGILALNNSNEIARIRSTGLQMINISGTLDFSNVDEEQDFINQTERAMLISVTRAASFHMLIEIPRMVYTAYSVGMAGRGRIAATFEGKGRYLTSSAAAIGIRLTTTKSNY